MPKIKVTIEGKEHEIDRPEGLLSQEEIDKDYLPRKTVNELYVLTSERDKQINDRFKNWVHKDKIAEDKPLLEKILNEHGKKSGEDGDKNIDELKAQWRAAEYDPVLKQNDQLKRLILGSSIREEASRYFDEVYTKPPKPGQPSYIESLITQDFEFDPELNYFVAKNGDKRLPAHNPTTERPFADVGEIIKNLSGEESYKGFLKKQVKNNDANYSGSQGNNGDSPVDVSGYKPRNEMSVDEKLAAIDKLGADGFMKIPEQRQTE